MPVEHREPWEEEVVLSRLLRCMDPCGDDLSVLEALQQLATKYSLDPHYRRWSAEVLRDELQNADLDSRLMGTWPGDWPGRQLVDLDNVGDSGFWIEDAFGESISAVLFGDVWDDEANAATIANGYLETIVNLGYPLPSDFSDVPREGAWSDEDERDIQLEFVAFLRCWRERVIQAIEKQAAPDGRVGP